MQEISQREPKLLKKHMENKPLCEIKKESYAAIVNGLEAEEIMEILKNVPTVILLTEILRRTQELEYKVEIIDELLRKKD